MTLQTLRPVKLRKIANATSSQSQDFINSKTTDANLGCSSEKVHRFCLGSKGSEVSMPGFAKSLQIEDKLHLDCYLSGSRKLRMDAKLCFEAELEMRDFFFFFFSFFFPQKSHINQVLINLI